MTGREQAPGRDWTCSLCGQVFFGRRFECPCRSKAEGREQDSEAVDLLARLEAAHMDCEDDDLARLLLDAARFVRAAAREPR